MKPEDVAAVLNAVGPRAHAATPEGLARLFAEAGEPGVTSDMIERDLRAGAPTNPDGTINLLHYTAWLVRRRSR